jgi:hypothetical protein
MLQCNEEAVGAHWHHTEPLGGQLGCWRPASWWTTAQLTIQGLGCHAVHDYVLTRVQNNTKP